MFGDLLRAVVLFSAEGGDAVGGDLQADVVDPFASDATEVRCKAGGDVDLPANKVVAGLLRLADAGQREGPEVAVPVTPCQELPASPGAARA